MPRLIAVLGFLYLAIGSVVAEEKPPADNEAAAQVLAAFEASDADAMNKLAARDAPDPWIVADVLCAQGAKDAALAFARAAPRHDVHALAAYVAGPAFGDGIMERRTALDASGKALVSGRFTDALAVVDARKDLSGDVPSVRLRFGRAIAMRFLKRHKDALAAYAEAGEAAEALGWHARVARAHKDARKEASRSGQRSAALKHAQARVAVEEARGHKAQIADAVEDLAHAHVALQQWEPCVDTFRRAGDLYAELGQAKRSAECRGNVGAVLQQLGRYDESLAILEVALEQKKAIGDERGAADTEHNMALIHEIQGQLALALRRHESVLGYHTAQKNSEWIANSTLSIGVVLFHMGRYAESFARCEKALELFTALRHRSGQAHTRLNLGNLYMRTGDYEKAIASYETARTLAVELGMALVEANAVMNTATAYMFAKREDDAIRMYEASIPLHEKARNLAGIPAALGNLGTIYRDRGEPDKALDHHKRALAESKRLGLHLAAVIQKFGVGADLAALKRWDEARTVLTEAENEARAFGAYDTLVDAVCELARVEYSAGRDGEAIAVAKRAIAEMPVLVAGQSDEAGARMRQRFLPTFEAGFLAAVALKEPAEACFFLESGRAGALLEALGGRNAMRGIVLSPELRAEEEAARGALAVALQAQRDVASAGDFRAARQRRKGVEVAQARLGAAVEKIQRRQKAAASVVYGEPDTLAVIQSRLRPDEALVLLAWSYELVHALVIGADSERIVRIGSVADVSAACEAFVGRKAAHDAGPAIARLKTLVADSLALGDGVRTLLVSAVGPLSYIPFALLFPEREVAYVPSGTTYGILLEEQAKRGTDIFAVGDPDYGVASDAARASVHRGAWSGKLARLPGTRAEVEALGTTTLLGREATEARVRAVLARDARWRAAHFACHGLVDPEKPMLSCLALTPDATSDGFLTCHDVFRMRVPADLATLSACETGRGTIYKAEGIVGLTRAFMYAGAPRVICSLWKVDDEATRALMVKFYELWNPKTGDGLGAAAALKRAQAYVRTLEVEVVDKEASRQARRTITKKVRKWAHPYYWAAWVLWGLPH